jgi:hypothetical protein
MPQIMTDQECLLRNAKSELMKAKALNPLYLLECETPPLIDLETGKIASKATLFNGFHNDFTNIVLKRMNEMLSDINIVK